MDAVLPGRNKTPILKQLTMSILLAGYTLLPVSASNLLPNLPTGTTIEDLIPDSGFEQSDEGYIAASPDNISLTANAIRQTQSLEIQFPSWQRITSYRNFGWGQGPVTHSLTAKAVIQVDQASNEHQFFHACSVAYLQSGSRVQQCQEIPTVPGSYQLYQEMPLAMQQLSRATIEFRYPHSGSVTARIDDANLYVVRPQSEAEQFVPATDDPARLIDLIEDAGFESSTSGFSSNNSADINLTLAAIQETQSLSLNLQDYRRVQKIVDWGWDQGPNVDSVTLTGKLRIDSTHNENASISVCAVAYLHNDNTRYESCQMVSSGEQDMVQLHSVLELGEGQVRRVFYELSYPGMGTVNVALDDAHLFLLKSAWQSGEDTGDNSEPGTGAGQQPGNNAPDPRVPDVAEGESLLEIIADTGFEHSMAGFSSPTDNVLSLSDDAIFGSQSLHLDLSHASWSRITSGHQWSWNAGPNANTVAIKAKVYVPEEYQSHGTACAIVYIFGGNRQEQCQTLSGHADYQDVYQQLSLANQQLDRVFFELRHPNSGAFKMFVDDAHLYVVTTDGSVIPPGGGDDGDTGGDDSGDGDSGGDDSGDGDNSDSPAYDPSTDLELVGFHINPSRYRNIVSSINRSDDVSGDGNAVNNSVRSISVDLHPSAEALAAGEVTVSFGLPLAPGAVVDTRNIKVLDDDGNELPAHVSGLLNWQSMPQQSLLCEGLVAEGNPGIRSALIQFDMAFSDTRSKPVTVVLNDGQRTLDVTEKTHPRSLFRRVNDGTYADDINTSGFTIYEPQVTAAIDHEYLICSGLNVFSNASGTREYMSESDEAQENFFYSTINQNEVKQDWEVTDGRDYIDYFSFTPAWLYGRPQTFINGYLRSGNIDMLREGLRATEHYAQNIWAPEDCADAFYPYCVGSFKLKNPNPGSSWQDMKYSNSRPLLTHYLLTGDETWLDKIGHIAWGMEFHVDLEGNGATARHRAYALDAYNVDYAITGHAHPLRKITNGMEAMLQKQRDGVADFGPNGCFNFSPEGGDNPNFSPWMLNLLTNVMLNTYQETGIADIPQSLVEVAQCEIDRAIVQLQPGENGPMEPGDYYPFYIASSYGEKEDVDGFNPYNGFEHAIDVATVVSLGAYFAQEAETKIEFVSIAKALLLTHELSIDAWTRETPGRAKYRVAPPRKYNWQYKHAGVLGWTLGTDEGGSGKPSY